MSKSKHPAYHTWYSMKRRCTNRSHKHYHRYGGRGVVVCPEWYSFTEFSIWYDDNYVKGYQLDKDILGDGKLYSPTSCCYIPAELNSLLCGNNLQRGLYPIGVHRCTKTDKFIATLSLKGKQKIFRCLYHTR